MRFVRCGAPLCKIVDGLYLLQFWFQIELPFECSAAGGAVAVAAATDTATATTGYLSCTRSRPFVTDMDVGTQNGRRQIFQIGPHGKRMKAHMMTCIVGGDGELDGFNFAGDSYRRGKTLNRNGFAHSICKSVVGLPLTRRELYRASTIATLVSGGGSLPDVYRIVTQGDPTVRNTNPQSLPGRYLGEAKIKTA